MRDLFWFTNEQLRRLEPFFLMSRGPVAECALAAVVLFWL